MLERLTRKAWLKIAAAVAAVAVMVIVVAVVVGGDDGTDEVVTGMSVTEPATEPSSPTTGDTTAPGNGATTALGDGARTAPVGGGTTTTATPPTSECADPVVGGEVFSRRDLDTDGVDELLVKTGAGASTDIIKVFRVEGCEALQVTMGGSPAEFPVGAAVIHIDGLQARSDTLVVYSGTSTDGLAFDVTWRTLRLDGSALTEIGADSGTAQLGDDLYRLASTFSA
jgi:hypothetical protein